MTDNELIFELLNIRDQMEDEHDAAVISAAANRLETLRPDTPPPGSVPVRIAVIRYVHDGDDYIECDVIYDDPEEVMESLQRHVHDGEATHKAIVTASLPAFAPLPTVSGQAEPCQFSPEEPTQ